MNKKMMAMDGDIENVGIMQGFMDSMSDEEADGDEDPEMMMERRPNSPEILMNNLRGDMRSIDARRDELADLVGYQAATETPETVLAMLQPVLAQQSGAGIGALPQSGPMAQGPQPPMMSDALNMPPAGMPPMPPDMGMPPPPTQGGIAELMAGMGGMPAGMPSSDQPPMAMATGGYVQNFSKGTGKGGASSVTTTPLNGDDDAVTDDDFAALYPPSLLAVAREKANNLLAKKPAIIPTLESLIQQRTPQYKTILGDTAGSSQAQLLFELGQRAFNFAGNVDEAGRPLKGGFVSRLAQASRTLPASIGQRVAEIDKGERQIKLLAMQAAEKDIDQIQALNLAMTKEQRALASKMLEGEAKVKAQAAAKLGQSIFGKGDWEQGILNQPNLLARWATGQTNATEDGLIDSAITSLSKETNVYTIPNPSNPSQPMRVSTPGVISDTVKKFQTQRNEFLKTGKATPVAVEAAPVDPSPGATITQPLTKKAASNNAPEQVNPPVIKPISLWRDRFLLTGPISGALAFISPLPGAGDPFATVTKARADAKLFVGPLVESLLKSTMGGITEQNRIKSDLGIDPSGFTDPETYGTRLIALGDFITAQRKKALALHSDTTAKNEDRLEAYKKATELQKIYGQLDLPPTAYTNDEYESLVKAGHPEVLWYGQVIQPRKNNLVNQNPYKDKPK